MALLIAEYRVQDPSVFRTVFDEFEPVRSEAGVTSYRLLHSVDDPAIVVVTLEFADAQAARAFADDPRRAEALQRAGVTQRADLILDEDASGP